MLRNSLALVAALIASFATIAILQYANYLLFPPPSGLDYSRPEDLAQIAARMPMAAFWMLELSYVAGSLAGGAVVAWLAADHQVLLALGIGLLLTIFNVNNLLAFPHPLWLAVLTTATFLPLTWLGARLVLRVRALPR